MSYYESIAMSLGINILMGIGLYIPMAAGLVSLGHAGFMAIGAYACALAVLVAVQLRRSRVGRAMIAVHEDEGAAEAMGVHLVYIKLMAFALGAFIAGVAGGFYAHYALYIEPAQFGFLRSAEAFLFVVIGGLSNVLG